MRALAFSILVAAVVLVAPRGADACSCTVPGPPCEEMFRATVFVGKAVSTVETKSSATTTFAISEVLHSDAPLGKTVDVSHGTVGSLCGITFTKGETYVVYAGGKPGALGVGMCSRTHVLTKNDEDVAFAHTKSKRTTALVEGTVALMDRGDSKPRAGVKVRVAGTKLEATSDKRGRFTLEVPPGTYQLEVVNPDLRVWRGDTILLAVPVPAACARPHINVQWDGRIAGKLTDAAGQPAANVEVGAMATSRGTQMWRLSARTAADGTYTIHEVPAGTYRVGVSIEDTGGVSPASPYPTTYFPGTPSSVKAKLVTVSRAGLTSGIDFALPKALTVRTIRVALSNKKDGSPAKGASVSVIPAGQNRSTGGLTDDKGTITIQELDGMDVTIRVCLGVTCDEVKKKLTSDMVLKMML